MMRRHVARFLWTLPIVLVGAYVSLLAQTPGDGIVRLDTALDKIVPKGAKVEKVLGGLGFTEGPVWDRTGGFLLFSDVPNNAIMKLIAGGTAEPFRKPIFEGEFAKGAQIGSNGLALDPAGRWQPSTAIAALLAGRKTGRWWCSPTVTRVSASTAPTM